MLRLLKPVRAARDALRSRSIAANTLWLGAERVVAAIVALGVGAWVARYLQPDGLGLLSYATAIVGFGRLFIHPGLGGIATRDIVRSPTTDAAIVGSAAALKLIGGLVGAVVCIVYGVLTSDDSVTRMLIAIASVALVLEFADTYDFWFQAKMLNRNGVIARITGSVCAGIVSVALVLSGAPVVWFAVPFTLNYAAKGAVGYALFRRSTPRSTRPAVDWGVARRLLRDSWPLLLMSLGTMINVKMDQAMLKLLAGDTEAGLYAVAAVLSQFWYFVPAALATSLYPSIIRAREGDASSYERRLLHALSAMAFLALGVIAGTALLGDDVVRLLYGEAYTISASVLIVHIWACPAVFMGMIMAKWLIAEDLLWFGFTRNALGACVNVGLNVWLIPEYGALGAAWATVASYTVSWYLACFTHPKTLRMGLLMTRALLNPFAWVPEVRSRYF